MSHRFPKSAWVAVLAGLGLLVVPTIAIEVRETPETESMTMSLLFWWCAAAGLATSAVGLAHAIRATGCREQGQDGAGCKG